MGDQTQRKEIREPETRGGIGILCFGAIIAGELWLIRNIWQQRLLSEHNPFYIAEFFFLLLLLAGIVILWTGKKGWGELKRRIVVFTVFGAYLIQSVLSYSTLSQDYLTGFQPEYASTAGAMVGIKLVLAVIGIIAGIPVGPEIEGHEYARRLREKALLQQAEWDKASARGAAKDLNKTIESLRNSLSEEEIQKLIRELKTEDNNS